MPVKKTPPKKAVKPAVKKKIVPRGTSKKPAAKAPATKKTIVVKKTQKKRPAPKTAFKKGGKPGPGRPKGKQNLITMELKEGIMQAFHNKGGVKYLEDLAENRKDLFVGLLKAILPAEIKATMEHKGDITYVVNTGHTNRPPIGVNNPNLKLIGKDVNK